MSTYQSKMYHGRVFHQRLQPKKHRLSYKICSFLFDIDEIPTLDQDLKIFSHNRFNVISFWDKDHGDGQEKPLRTYVEDLLAKADIALKDAPIKLLCYPRLFGYVFNPLSVYYCYDHEDHLKAVIYEVSNTFGQRHSYVIGADADKGRAIRQSCKKEFYVSPFIEMEADYHFILNDPGERLSVLINQTNDKGPLLKACFSGHAFDISEKSLRAMLFKYPLMTVKVMVGIHWEALKLWRKGLKLIKRPEAPSQSFTHVRINQLETKT